MLTWIGVLAVILVIALYLWFNRKETPADRAAKWARQQATRLGGHLNPRYTENPRCPKCGCPKATSNEHDVFKTRLCTECGDFYVVMEDRDTRNMQNPR